MPSRPDNTHPLVDPMDNHKRSSMFLGYWFAVEYGVRPDGCAPYRV